MILMNGSSEPVNGVVEYGEKLDDSLSRSNKLRPSSVLIIPIQRGRVNGPYQTGSHLRRGLTRMDCGGHDLIAIPPGKFLGEYNVPLAG